jgi:hypothetical protein
LHERQLITPLAYFAASRQPRRHISRQLYLFQQAMAEVASRDSGQRQPAFFDTHFTVSPIIATPFSRTLFFFS